VVAMVEDNKTCGQNHNEGMNPLKGMEANPLYLVELSLRRMI